MRQVRSASRYAQALLTLAKEQSLLKETKRDMDLVLETLNQNRDLRVVLLSPVIRTEKKEAILKAVFEKEISQLSLRFLNLLTQKGREMYLTDIAKSYQSLWRTEMGIKKAFVASATPLNEAQRAELLTRVKAWAGSEIELEETVDETLIGGFVLRVEDQQIDTSLSSRLKTLKSDFGKNLYIAEF